MSGARSYRAPSCPRWVRARWSLSSFGWLGGGFADGGPVAASANERIAVGQSREGASCCQRARVGSSLELEEREVCA